MWCGQAAVDMGDLEASKGDLSATDAKGQTALIRSIVAGERDTFQWLLEAKAPVDSPPLTHTALRAAALYGRVDFLRELLARGADPRIPSAHGRTPLMGCGTPRSGVTREQSLSCAKLLLEDQRGKSTLHFVNDDGETALHLATVGGHTDLADLLCQ